MIDERKLHAYFDLFLEQNPHYKNSPEPVIEDYYAIFKAGSNMTYDAAWNVGYEDGQDYVKYNYNLYDD